MNPCLAPIVWCQGHGVAFGEKCITLPSICWGQPRITFRWTSPCSQERSKPTALGLLILRAHGSLNLNFSVCQTLGYRPFPAKLGFQFRENRHTFIHSLAVCLCIISVISPCDPVSRDCRCYYFHFIDENTEAQRLACSAQPVNGKAGLGTQVLPSQAPTWQPPL